MTQTNTTTYRAHDSGAIQARFGSADRSPPPWIQTTPDHIAESADEFQNEFKIRVVKNANWRHRTHSLVERRYAWRGYSVSPPEVDAGGRLTLSASVEDTTVATISAGLDSPKGMYVSALYPDVVQALRDDGRKLCEFTRLAVDESVRSRAVLGAIFHVANMYVSNLHRCTDVLVEVNPRHVLFYQRMLGFEKAAEERIDTTVNAPAVLLRLDLDYSAKEIARLGGSRKFARGERSFYPYFFAVDEEAAIVSRLRMH